MNDQYSLVLPISVFPPVGYFKLLLKNKTVIDSFENYIKQSFRNRFKILAANGSLDLTIPVKGQMGNKIASAFIEIDNDKDWKRQHWRSIVSAYRSSPFFEHYEGQINQVIMSTYDTLNDMAITSIKTSYKLLKLEESFSVSSEYIEQADLDLRPFFKERDLPQWPVEPKPYPQVFQDKYGFTANLSILDLLFNEGPAAKLYL